MRLGDLDTLKEDIVKLCRQINASNGITVPTLAFTRVIDNAPTVDLKDIYQEGHYDGHLEGYTKAINEERPHGEWIKTDGNSFECPFCHRLFDFGDNYCGFCGADMQKGGAEEYCIRLDTKKLSQEELDRFMGSIKQVQMRAVSIEADIEPLPPDAMRKILGMEGTD